ncbi:MAG: PilT/PilU family type 4a pilus ATPase [Gammaproteobacteria bacterium]|nr:PilT/PilU family type 4a pilus ATPase [Gammaproteobacteria bacterium]
MDIHQLLDGALASGASDLHLSAHMPPLLRVDGALRPMPGFAALNAAEVGAMLDAVMDEAGRRHFSERWQNDFSLETPAPARRRFRVSAYRQRRGPAAVFRPVADNVPRPADLGAPRVLGELALARNGLLLVTGAAGSGKSTTLAALLGHHAAHRAAHIITVEDPIEFVHDSGGGALFSQREVHRDTRSFPDALRAALRADPDVVMVGEVRDTETMRLALTAAETGHLVMATLHTVSAARSVGRVADLFPSEEKPLARALLAESLRGVVSQALVKRKTGGRTAAFEILTATHAVRSLIRENKTAQIYSAIQSGGGHGMQTLDQSLRALVESGTVDMAEARPLMAAPGE